MSSLKEIISKVLRGPKPSPKSRWINTRVESAWDPVRQRYVETYSEGYWYEGPMALAHDVAAVYEAEDYRWVNDNGTHPTSGTPTGGEATFVAAENTAINVNILSTTQYRLRVNVAESNTAAGTGAISGSWTLQYQINTNGWNTVGSATDVRYFDSTHLTNGTAIQTAEFALNYGGAANVPQAWGDTCEDGVSISNGDWSNDFAEIEFTVDFAANLSSGDTVTFRVLAPNGAAITFSNVPTANIIATATASGTPSITKPTASGAANAYKTASGPPSI